MSDNQSPYAAKSIYIDGILRNLYGRNTGIQFPLVVGPNTIDFTVPVPWVKFTGLEIVNCEKLETVDLFTIINYIDPTTGLPAIYTKQFGFSYNLANEEENSTKPFDADLKLGTVIRVIYHAKTEKTVGINFMMDEVI